MEDNKRIFTEVIKRQMAILGPDITLAKVKNVPGIEVDSTGQVTNVTGDPKVLLQGLINQFVELSGLIVKKTMESILSTSPAGVAIVGQMAGAGLSGVATPQATAPQMTQSPPIRSDVDNTILSANRDIDDLNKMLNNVS